jgi:hypothetical protein
MRRPYKITILEDPSPERRTKLAKLTKTIRAGLYLVPAETVAKSVLLHLCRELSPQQR